MLTDGSSEGLQFVVASGYRDVETQQQLLDEDIEADMQNEGMSWQEAYDKETMETMPPGYSEHSTDWPWISWRWTIRSWMAGRSRRRKISGCRKIAAGTASFSAIRKEKKR